MIRFFQTAILAGVAMAVAACADSNPTAPARAPAAAAAENVVGLSAPSATASCTVVQLDATHFEVTATWSGLSVVGLELFNGAALLVQTQFSHPIRNGSVTDTILTAPTILQLNGKSLGVRTPCA